MEIWHWDSLRLNINITLRSTSKPTHLVIRVKGTEYFTYNNKCNNDETILTIVHHFAPLMMVKYLDSLTYKSQDFLRLIDELRLEVYLLFRAIKIGSKIK